MARREHSIAALWAAVSWAAIMPSNSSFGPMQINAGGALICLSRVGGNASKAPPRSGGSAGFGVGRNERQGLITDREIELGRVICHICGAP
jgi:hypothetical protein